MQTDPADPVPVAELQYQTETHVRAIDLVMLVAKWCAFLGAMSAGNFALQLFGVYVYRASLGMAWMRSMLIGIAVEVIRIGIAIWLLGCAIRVMRGKLTSAQQLWRGLAGMIALSVIGLIANLIFNASYGSLRDGFSILSAIMNIGLYLLPPAILLTIVRQPSVRDAIEGY
jgi:hypothetical protein